MSRAQLSVSVSFIYSPRLSTISIHTFPALHASSVLSFIFTSNIFPDSFFLCNTMASLFSFLNEITPFDTKVRARNKKVGVCKDEVDQMPLPLKPMKTKVKKTVRFETKPLVYEKDRDMESGIGSGPGNKKAELKVKIIMTKDEAARLLSKCKDGGRLEFKDVAHELVKIPINRVNLVSSRDHCLIEGIDRKEL